ncbi:TetR/AcrR family transcriptional regulator [Streptomyces bottropensis]|uniref:TetR/AcrR family transcriptional regulator n=1 Tax=Streptomyces bottropensis TaxID=42235 RepID=UPI0036B7E0E4
MRAAVELVTERGTAAVPLSDIAEAADVSQRVVYQHFGDRDALLLEAGLDLARRELLPQLADAPPGTTTREQTLATARHFAGHGAALRRPPGVLQGPVDRIVRVRAGPGLDRAAAAGQPAARPADVQRPARPADR